jgi:hypothetical protein
MGSIGIAAWIATLAFPVLVVWGWLSGELGPRGIVIFLVLGVASRIALPLLPYGATLAPSALALIDIALVFAVFKGDVRIG